MWEFIKKHLNTLFNLSTSIQILKYALKPRAHLHPQNLWHYQPVQLCQKLEKYLFYKIMPWMCWKTSFSKDLIRLGLIATERNSFMLHTADVVGIGTAVAVLYQVGNVSWLAQRLNSHSLSAGFCWHPCGYWQWPIIWRQSGLVVFSSSANVASYITGALLVFVDYDLDSGLPATLSPDASWSVGRQMKQRNMV